MSLGLLIYTLVDVAHEWVGMGGRRLALKVCISTKLTAPTESMHG